MGEFVRGINRTFLTEHSRNRLLPLLSRCCQQARRQVSRKSRPQLPLRCLSRPLRGSPSMSRLASR